MRSRTGLVLSALVAAFLVAPGPADGQQSAISGTVTGADGSPLANVTVQVVGTELGALTDDAGEFRIPIDPGTYELRARLIGYRQLTRSVTVEPDEVTRVSLVLRSQAVDLGGLVATVAARQQQRVEVGTDIAQFDAAEAVEQSGAANLSDLLNARATGLQISESSGGAGTASRIRVRGTSSLTQDNNPIIYIDGVRVSNATGTGPGSFDFANGQTISRLDDLDPQQIASIQVVKGPSAAAQYGSEAAAGVILVETKEGTGLETAQLQYSHRQGVTSEVADYWANYLNVSQFGVTSLDDERLQGWTTERNPVTGQIFVTHNPFENPVTDPFRAGRSVQNLLSIRGSAEGFSYYGSLQHQTEEGTFQNNNLEGTSLRANFQVSPAEDLNVSVSTGYIDNYVRLPDNDRSGVGMVTNGGAGLPLFSFGVTPSGGRGECLASVLAGMPESACAATEGNLTARFDKLETIRNEQDVQRFVGSVNANWEPVEWLTGRLVLGVDQNETRNVNLVPLDPDQPFGSNSAGLRAQEELTNQVFTLDAGVTGDWALTEAISTSTSVGTQVFRERTESIGCEGRGFASPGANACDAALNFDGSSGVVESLEVGGFVQQQVSYRDYLFGTGALRVDDNSTFGEEEGVIVSPSANASAVLTEMPFWDVEEVNQLRLRFAWGKAAQAPAPFAKGQFFEPIRVVQEGESRIGVEPVDPGNPELSAERSEEFEFGFDAGFLDGRAGLSVTYFDSETTDAILPTNVAPSTGFTGTQFVNVGALENHGFELSADARVIQKEDLTWDVRFQHSTQDSEITDLGGIPPIVFGLGADHQMHREGFAPGAYWAREVASAERDENGAIVPGSVELKPGDVGDPNRPNDRFQGRPFPGNEQSVSTTVRLFDRLEVSTSFDRAGDFVKADLSQEFRSPFIPGTSVSGLYAMRQERLTPEEQAAMEHSEFTNNGLFIQDATFVKWRSMTVRYDLPSALTDLAGPVTGASLTVGGRNLATMTDYGGLDPELSYDGGRDSFNAAEFFTQPPGRTFFARMDVVF